MAFWKKNKQPERVRIYDPDTGNIATIPAAELAPTMVQVNLRVGDGQVEERVWVDSTKLHPSPYRHPPFSEEVREYFRTLKQVLDEVDPKSLEEWEDGFRRDQDWEQELRIFLRIAEVYYHLTHGENVHIARKQDIYRVLVGCTLSPREQVLGVVSLSALSRQEALTIIAEFFDGP
jgi:hypothetical protein